MCFCVHDESHVIMQMKLECEKQQMWTCQVFKFHTDVFVKLVHSVFTRVVFLLLNVYLHMHKCVDVSHTHPGATLQTLCCLHVFSVYLQGKNT